MQYDVWSHKLPHTLTFIPLALLVYST